MKVWLLLHLVIDFKNNITIIFFSELMICSLPRLLDFDKWYQKSKKLRWNDFWESTFKYTLSFYFICNEVKLFENKYKFHFSHIIFYEFISFWNSKLLLYNIYNWKKKNTFMDRMKYKILSYVIKSRLSNCSISDVKSFLLLESLWRIINFEWE